MSTGDAIEAVFWYVAIATLCLIFAAQLDRSEQGAPPDPRVSNAVVAACYAWPILPIILFSHGLAMAVGRNCAKSQ